MGSFLSHGLLQISYVHRPFIGANIAGLNLLHGLQGHPIAVLAAPLTYYIVMWNLFYPKNVFLELTAENMTRIGESIILLAAYVIAVIGGTLVVGHGLSCLMLIPKKNRIFDPDPMKRADHLGVKWTLQRYKLLPKNDLIWLNRMEKMGVVSRLKKDNYKLSGTSALIKSAEDEKAE